MVSDVARSLKGFFANMFGAILTYMISKKNKKDAVDMGEMQFLIS